MALTDKLTAIADAIRSMSGKTDGLTMDQMPAEILDINPLNFKVVSGTTKPSNAVENMIWVNTDTTISGYVFSATQPTSPAEGMAWITVDTSSPVAFNALKKNSLMVYPMTAKQYVSGAWADVEAKSYQGGEWAQWGTHLYNNGDECTDITGGWVDQALRINPNYGGAAAPTITRAVDSIKFNASSQANVGGVARTADKIDLSDYATLEFTGYMYGNGFTRLYVWSEMNSNGWENSSPAAIGGDSDKTIRTKTLDISNLSGEYYIGFSFYGDTSAEVLMKKMLLKK